MPKDINQRFREFWNERNPELPCWVDPKNPAKEFSPWEEMYQNSNSELGIRAWAKENNYNIYRLDFTLRDYCLCVETDGQMHGTAKTVQKDRRKSNELQKLGYIVLRYPAQTVVGNMVYIEDEILDTFHNTTWVD